MFLYSSSNSLQTNQFEALLTFYGPKQRIWQIDNANKHYKNDSNIWNKCKFVCSMFYFSADKIVTGLINCIIKSTKKGVWKAEVRTKYTNFGKYANSSKWHRDFRSFKLKTKQETISITAYHLQHFVNSCKTTFHTASSCKQSTDFC